MVFGLSKKIKDIIPVTLFVISAIIWRTSFYSVGLYILLPVIILYSFWKYKKAILTSEYFVLYSALVFWMYISSIFNLNIEESLNALVPVLATYLLSFAVLSLSQNGNNSNILALGYVCLFATILYSTVTNDSFTSDFDYANEAERYENTEMNANQYAYFSLFAIMSVRLMLGKRRTAKPLLRILLYFLMAGLSFYVALMTASRQVLLLEIPVLLFFIYYDFWRGGSSRIRVLIVSAFVLFLIFVLPQAIDLYDSSYLAVRSSEDLQEDERSFLLMLGLQEGLDNPIIGLGLSTDTLFTHCTYTHLMSRCGIPSLLCFLCIIFKSLIDQYRHYVRTRNSYFIMYLFLLFIFAIANFFYSYIDQPYMLTILFLIVGDSEKMYHQLNKSKRTSASCY